MSNDFNSLGFVNFFFSCPFLLYLSPICKVNFLLHGVEVRGGLETKDDYSIITYANTDNTEDVAYTPGVNSVDHVKIVPQD